MKGYNCMRKISYLAALVIIISINMSGCGKAENSTNSSSNTRTDKDISINDNNKDRFNNSTPENNKNNDNTSSTPSPEVTLNPEETVKTKIFKIAGDKPYSDINKEVTILGLKEYKKLESNKYTDTSKKWKKIEIIYDGWKDIDNISIKAEFTPKDLSAPLIYNPNDYL